MKMKQTVLEKYSKELEEISQQIKLIKTGDSLGIDLMSNIKSLMIVIYYDGKCEGVQQIHEILKN